MKRFINQYKFTIIAVILVLIGILMPGDDVPSVGIPNLDKVVHCGMFGFVTLCFYWDYSRATHKMPRFVLSLAILILFAGSTEIMQMYVPGRSCDYRDLIADTIGILLAKGVARTTIIQYKNKRDNDKKL